MQKGREFLGEKCKRFLVRASPIALQPELTILPHDDDDYVISNYVDYEDDDDGDDDDDNDNDDDDNNNDYDDNNNYDDDNDNDD